MLSQQLVAVGLTPTLLVTAGMTGQIVAVNNLGSSTLYLGNSDVSSVTGVEVASGETWSIDLAPGEYLYGIRSLGSANALVLAAPPLISTQAVPQRINLGLGASLPASPATVITNVSGLPVSPSDGQLALLRVGTAPDVEYVELMYDATNTQWVSPPQSLISQTDQIYMGTNTTSYSYLSTDTTGSAANEALGWTTKPIWHASDIFAAGLKLQAVFTGIIQASSTPANFTVMPRFFQHNSGDTVTFSSDGSTAVSELQTTLIGLTNTPIFQSTGWTNVVNLGTQTPSGSADILKKLLWPRLYAKVASGVAYGEIIDADLRVRWVH